jgi:hypothetical protein
LRESCERCFPKACESGNNTSDTPVIGIAVGSVAAVGVIGIVAVLYIKRGRSSPSMNKSWNNVASTSQAALTQSTGNLYGSDSNMSSPGISSRSNTMKLKHLNQMSSQMSPGSYLEQSQAASISRANSRRMPNMPPPPPPESQGYYDGSPQRSNTYKMQARSPMQLSSNALDRPQSAGESPPGFQTAPINMMPRANPMLRGNPSPPPRFPDAYEPSQTEYYED